MQKLCATVRGHSGTFLLFCFHLCVQFVSQYVAAKGAAAVFDREKKEREQTSLRDGET